jgi:hypothetical protein
MATLTRPGVEIAQEITAGAPTILTPTLVPCLVGPCFQIVSPLTEDGALNTGAIVSVAALVQSDQPLPAALSLSGRSMQIKVNNGQVQTINFPVTINGEAIDHALTVNTINKQLTGAVAEIVGDKLNIRTNSKGSSQSIELINIADPNVEAYSLLEINQLVGVVVTGQSQYTNISYTVPYSSFPSPMASVDEVVITDENTKMYRYFGGTLREFSEDSAINTNAYAWNVMQVADHTVASAHSPAFGDSKSWMFGKVKAGSKTDTMQHLGSDAYLEFPLCHDVAPDGGSLGVMTQWPDPRGKNKIVLHAKGMSDYTSSGILSSMGTAASLGNAGNNLSLTMSHNAGLGDGATVVYTPGTGLEVTVSDDTTFATLAAAIAASPSLADASGEMSVTLESDVDDPAVATVRNFTAGNPAGAPWNNANTCSLNLSYGSDPVDFSIDAPVAEGCGQGEANNENLSQAHVCGAVPIGGGDTATDLGIAGETISVSIDGGAAVSHTFIGGDPVIGGLNTALTGVGTATQVGYALSNDIGETFQPIRITSVSDNGHDSTIEISADNALVIQRLFSGSASGSGSAAPAAQTAALNEDRGGLLTSAAYNAVTGQNESVNQRALVPGSVTIQIDGAVAIGCIAGIGDDTCNATAGNAAATVNIEVDGGATSFDVNMPAGGWPGDPGAAAAAMQAGIVAAGGGLDSQICASEHAGTVVISRFSGNVGDSIAILSTGDADLAAYFANTDVTSTCEATSITLRDSGASPAFRVECTAASTGSQIGVAGTLDEWVMGGAEADNTGRAATQINYSSGDINFAFAGDDFAGAYADAHPITMKLGAAPSATVTYNRSWANTVQAAKQGYTGKLHHGQSNRTILSDFVSHDGNVLGRVSAIEDFAAGGATFSGAQVVLSEFALDNKQLSNKWYMTADGVVAGSVDNPRVEPEASGNDLEQIYTLKHALNRDSSGVAISGGADIYVDYSALRRDVTGSAADPGLLVFNSIAEVEANIGPISPDNPLAFGMYLAFLNTSNINIAAFGVDEVTADAPQGTVKAYAEALDFLQMKEVYALAPLTHDMEVFKVFNQHVNDMSAPTGKKERMVLCCPELPSEKPSILAFSSTDFEISPEGGGKWRLTDANGGNIMLALNESTVKDANGNPLDLSVGDSLLPEQDVYIDREGDPYRYLITALPAADAVIIEPANDVWRPGVYGPGTGGNADAYYNNANPEDWAATGEGASIFVRQAATDLSTTGGKLATCETLAEIAGGPTGFQNRRLVLVLPDQVGVSIGGLESAVNGYYLCGAIAAMIGQQNPSQPFTNLPMVGFTRPIGSNDLFSENAMSTAAAGGIYWVIQDNPGGALVSRHQLTTDLTSIKTREMSILKAVDYVAKLMRGQVKRFIGRNNITKQLLEAISLGMQGSLASVTGSVVAEATLDSLTQDSDQPDTIRAEVTLVPFYPANYIKITIYV